jgi:hypothetical protein
MDNEYLLYKQKVWQFLDNMAPDDVFLIEKLCIPENRQKFILCVKSYMDAAPWQGWLSFNRDYTKIYKIHEIQFKKDIPIE